MKTPDEGECWGILGGTFDPIHNGHIQLAFDIQKIKNLDGILLIPSFLHPFKKEHTSASFEDRLRMLQLASQAYKTFYISTIEKEKQLSGFTIDTIRAIKNEYPKTMFNFLIGADNIEQFPIWHHASEIIDEIHVVAGKRPPFQMQNIENDFSNQIEYIETTELEISSTEIKQMILEHKFEKLSTILDPKVLQYITERNLYSYEK